MAQKRNIEGYTYHQERGFDIAEKVAENESVGEFSNLGIGMGMISGVGNTLGGMVSNVTSQIIPSMVAPTNPNVAVTCPHCGKQIAQDSKFCSNCGQALANAEKCLNCGHIWNKGEAFCPNCGNKR